jgi:hypothetical protein
LALSAVTCAAIFVIVNAPPPAKKAVVREPPSRTLAYEQAIATPSASDSEADASVKTVEPKKQAPAAKSAAPATPPKTPDDASSEQFPALPETAEDPDSAAGTPPRVAAVPRADPNATRPPMGGEANLPWAPEPEDEPSGQDGDGQWGNEAYDQGTEPYDQGTDQWGGPPPPPGQWGGPPPPPDQWGNEPHDPGTEAYGQQGNDQLGNEPYGQGNEPYDQAYGQDGSVKPDQWGHEQPPGPGQWADQNTEGGEQWVRVVLSGAEMRAGAADNAPLLFAFPSGRNLRVISFHEGWAQVTDPQSAATGWMKLHYLAPANAPRPGYEPQYDAYYEEPPRERRGLFRRGGFADMINRAFGGGN